MPRLAITRRLRDGSVLGIQVFLGPKVAIEKVEAVAIKKGILLALNERWKKVIIESDCFVVVEEWRTQSGDSLWSASEILNQARKDFVQFFDSFEIRWTPKNCNVTAHQASNWGLKRFSPTKDVLLYPD